jgi:hypothetical protein
MDIYRYLPRFLSNGKVGWYQIVNIDNSNDRLVCVASDFIVCFDAIDADYCMFKSPIKTI